jgi:CBS domain-containing protein
MTAEPLCISPDTPARDLARMLEANDISGMPVVDVCNRVIGVVSKTDLLRRAVEGPMGSGRGSFFESLAEGLTDDDLHPDNLGTVEEFMTPAPLTAGLDDSVSDVARRMAENGVHRIVIVDDNRVVLGLVTSLDVLRAFPG